MSEWKEYKLGELGTVITGKTPSSSNPEDWGEEMLFITPSDYRNFGKHANDSERKLSSIGIERLKNKVLPPKSILVTCIGSDMGKVVMNDVHCITNQQINTIIPDINVDNDFLYYMLVSIYDTLRVYGGDGTAVPIVNKKDFENIKVELPVSIDTQRRIASILTSLDDKIDLLRHENTTLEAMAETLFKELVLDKENNGTLEQIMSIQNGYAFKSKDFKDTGAHKVIKIKNISDSIVNIDTTDYIDNNAIIGLSSKFKISSGDILIAMTGAEIGKSGIIPKNNKSLWLNQRVGLLVEKFKGSKYIAYLQLKSDYGQDYIENTATGSAQPNISGIGIEKCGFPVFKQEDLIHISMRIGELYDKIIFNLGQINILKETRDYLLPRLMSNEIVI